MFRRKPEPQPVYGRDLWDQEHLIWPTQRAPLTAFRDLEDWPRRPMLTVPRDHKDPGTEGVVFYIPPWWYCTTDVPKTVLSIITTRLGITDPVATWQTAGIQPRVTIT